MESVTISPKFQVVIPRPIRESMHLKAGQKLQVVRYHDRIELVPLRPLGSLRGFVKGIDTSFDREQDRR